MTNKFFSTLVVAETKQNLLNPSLYKILNATKKLNNETHILISGNQVSGLVDKLKQTVPSEYASKIIVVDHQLLNNQNADVMGQVIQFLVQKNGYKFVACDAGTFGKDVIPRVAAMFDSQAITDVVEVKDQNTFKRPVYAGNAFNVVSSEDDIKFLTFRQTNFDNINQSGDKMVEQVETMNAEEMVKNKERLASYQGDKIGKSDKIDLNAAKKVLGGGRGIKSKELFAKLDELAALIGNCAVGATKAIVDNNFCSSEIQIGQTGKIIAPELYIAFGVSGAIQHVSGVKDAKVIAAINTNPDAPIFEVCNYGLVGDVSQVIPEMIEKLKSLKK
eukprot:TRINITY_DN1698_c0_g1_i2.p1 TRINITY_DN1698_c0_g1~~TRINITY_DN1698_c0_g1_i2.p1  ORF type:complete len:332 (+),score=87.53 TRINITY_DN1698_c0_g1_i2:153-1148(+)